MNSSVAVIIATHNRARSLRQTLEAMARIDLQGIDASWIIVNNSCTDDTDTVVSSFRDQLNVQLLHEPKPGKNRAVNRALEIALQREIVIFTDDDVVPDASWLSEIAASCSRWPDHDIFGGRIHPLWPTGRKPSWVTQDWMLSIGFAHHDIGHLEREYPAGHYPFGPNFWVRSRVFAQGLRFPENIGPAGSGRIMGSETALLHQLFQRGCRMVYCPAASVGHRVKPDDCRITSFAQRMHSHGRGRARIHGIGDWQSQTHPPTFWRSWQHLKWLCAKIRMIILQRLPESRARNEQLLWQHSEIGWIEESLRITDQMRLK
jgi:hypothetical protein